MRMFQIALILVLQLSISAKGVWVFLDLGNTIIDTRTAGEFKYFPKAHEFLRALHNSGLSVAAISNIPESFGASHEEKLETLKDYIKENWQDESFAWDELDAIFLPLSNAELKPNETLYLRALRNAEECPAIYISENLKEVQKAQELGMAAYLFDYKGTQAYPEVSHLEEFIIQNYHRDYSKDCIIK
ncbi:haloacid dehalogenase [Bacteriovorax sp. Seq25_V]|uniref:haloacid dehalogenase n=1 Tax=Bacteriovorax sp. Seq25_V TaxID=1201288 RepID=UPI00038A2EA8|nr:haloacid dehalogenase [Bacteriovorax sp. Seq25_V]EQC43823.1 haloacid dehalogenase-like hydrolase domain protein [Bacteriovorax sp. Seq25_V]